MPGQRPSLTSTSLWQTPHAVTLTRTVPGDGSGIGRSTISNSRFAADICATRIVFIATSPICNDANLPFIAQLAIGHCEESVLLLKKETAVTAFGRQPRR